MFKIKSVGVKRLSWVLGGVGALCFAVFAITNIPRNPSAEDWILVPVVCVVSFVAPFTLTRAIAWVVEGFQSQAGEKSAPTCEASPLRKKVETVGKVAALILLASLVYQQRSKQTVAQVQQAASVAAQNSILQAANDWEQAISKRDPDFAKYASFVTDRTRALQAANPARSPAEAVAMLEQAYREVSAQFKAAIPAPAKVTAPKSGLSSGSAP